MKITPQTPPPVRPELVEGPAPASPKSSPSSTSKPTPTKPPPANLGTVRSHLPRRQLPSPQRHHHPRNLHPRLTHIAPVVPASTPRRSYGGRSPRNPNLLFPTPPRHPTPRSCEGSPSSDVALRHHGLPVRQVCGQAGIRTPLLGGIADHVHIVRIPMIQWVVQGSLCL